MLAERRALFCAQLKTVREKRGVSLHEISASTKISASLFKGLESNDLSRWPKGLYRRSYFRDYLRAVDLPLDSTLAEFLRLFPDDDRSALDGAASDVVRESCTLAMTLANDPAERSAHLRRRIMGATFDGSVVVALSGAASLLIQTDVWMTGAVVAVGYYSAATVVAGRGFAWAWLDERGSWRKRLAAQRQKRMPAPSVNRTSWLEKLPSRTAPPLSITGEG